MDDSLTPIDFDGARLVVILGAGASRGAAHPTVMPPPPLVRDFIRAAERFRPGFQLEALLPAARALTGLAESDSLDVETLVTALARTDETSPRVREEAVAAVAACLDVMADDEISRMNLPSAASLQVATTRDLAGWCLFALRVATGRVCFEMLSSSDDRWNRWTCPHHSELASRLRPHERVISFNYDLVYDNALWMALGGREQRDWSDDLQATLYGWIDDVGESIRPMPGQGRLLKPHGSSNWMGLCRPTRSGEQWHGLMCVPPDLWISAFGNEQPDVAQGWEPAIALPHESAFALGSDRSNRIGCLTHPFLYLRDEVVRAIDAATACVAIGYSFRDEHDAVGRAMLAKLIARQVPTYIVGDPELPERLRGLGLKRSMWLADSIGPFVARFRADGTRDPDISRRVPLPDRATGEGWG